ncbi:hypothetical protein [Streptomyces sp. H27-C3]|uniref:hypothetical protein n=1 Tax=Streptomyces sp. H27-C3 TaxID=3046305 RepID=UPI0024BB2AC8|nr:hypothetical protein [Streptomyces sp. H27-C3]MDJ0463068.1 hypothetical protein [Streptomyces sp. H27-C3]
MSNYVMISAQEFCDVTGLTMARFKRYRSLMRKAPADMEPFPPEVYEYNTTVIFDTGELCEWFIDLYTEKITHEEERLSEAVKTLQTSLKVNDLNTIENWERAFTTARLALVGYTNRERPATQKRLDQARSDYFKLPKEILTSKKVLAESERVLKELTGEATSCQKHSAP